MSDKNKCADIEYSDDYNALMSGVTNPYCYNFGKIKRSSTLEEFKKLQNKVNTDYFYKR